MKRIIISICLLVFVVSCQDGTVGPKKNKVKVRFVSDHTPYIIGLIQYSPDTTFHYPEVLVGYFSPTSNQQDTCTLTKGVPGHLTPILHYPGLWSIMLTRQASITSMRFFLCWQPESHSVVTVRGPLGTASETKVTFVSEGHGVYGDVNNALPLRADGKYKLRVALPNGRVYGAKTYIPEAVPIQLKDSASAEVVYELRTDYPAEGSPKGYRIVFHPPDNGSITVLQRNSNRDRQLFLLEPNQKFRYAGYGPYLREGNSYYVGLTRDTLQLTYEIPWSQLLMKPRDEIWSSQHYWLRFSFFSSGIGKEFHAPFIWVAGSLHYFSHFGSKAGRAAKRGDTTYLHRVSTILKIGENGKALPKDSSDAIGFFGGEYSRYLQTTVYANRQFNLDSVWTAWHNKNK